MVDTLTNLSPWSVEKNRFQYNFGSKVSSSGIVGKEHVTKQPSRAWKPKKSKRTMVLGWISGLQSLAL
jgi:hypothetical protein